MQNRLEIAPWRYVSLSDLKKRFRARIQIFFHGEREGLESERYLGLLWLKWSWVGGKDPRYMLSNFALLIKKFDFFFQRRAGGGEADLSLST